MNAEAKRLGCSSGWQVEHNLDLSPEEALIAWLLWLPADADPTSAAMRELRRAEFQQPTDHRLRRLAELLHDVAACNAASGGMAQ